MRHLMPARAFARLSLFALSGFLTLWGTSESTQAQPQSLNVTNFGARGDAVRFLGTTVSNSAVITVQSTNQFSNADAGKLIQLFGVGTPTTATNYQDLIATVQSVSNGTNITISIPPSASSNNVYCVIGTQNAGPFQQCINKAGTNAVITIPDGTYLLVPPLLLDPRYAAANCFAMIPAVTITNGGLRLVGDSTNAVLLGNGAWLQKTNYLQRGTIFFLQGPVLDAGSLSFENLTFDGGVQVGNRAYRGFPARSTDGDGWDMSHGAVLDVGRGLLHRSKTFTNCTFIHWRGEILKSGTSGFDGLNILQNCRFYDGNASALNFTFTYNVQGCIFDTLDMAMEFYMGYSTGDSVFQNNIVTNVRNGFVICGALTNNTRPTITFTNNTISAASIGIMMSPARHITIVSNKFYNTATGIMPNGVGYQGTDHSGDFLIQGNAFTNCQYAFQNAAGSGASRLINATIQNNIAINCAKFAYGYGWGTNVSCNGNIVIGGAGADSCAMPGQWYLDDISNQFPPQRNFDYQFQTNIISYVTGMRQTINATKTNSVFLLDDSHAQQVPAGAMLVISNVVKLSIPVYLSNLHPLSPPIILRQGDAITCQWMTNGTWQMVTAKPAPASSLHLLVK